MKNIKMQDEAEWIMRTKSRLQRALFRAIKNSDRSEWVKRTVRILEHAYDLGWIR